MGKREKVIDIRIDEKEAKPEISKSDRKKAFELIIKNYKEQNPIKYEMKKDALKEKLNSL